MVAPASCAGLGAEHDVVTGDDEVDGKDVRHRAVAGAHSTDRPRPEDVPALLGGERGWAVEDLAAAIGEEPGAFVCMSSHGRGRTGALLGSVAEGILRGVQGPCLLVGPRCARERIDAGDRLAIAVDDSPAADEVLGLGGSWAVTFDLEPWVVTSLDPAGPAEARALVGADHVDENAGVHRLASHLQAQIGREVEWEILHGKHPAERISQFATQQDVAIVVMGTHTSKGAQRLRVGSVCAATAHRAPCPVLTHRTIG
jgi:nucleotide-binding universal stress UspA family protein